jgi:hypothetical protein
MNMVRAKTNAFNGLNVDLGSDAKAKSDVQIKIENYNGNPDIKVVSEEERSVESAKKLAEDMESMIPPEKIIEALSLLVDCYYCNPLIISKYLITDVKVLHRLLTLLCNVEPDKVEIRYDDITAFCGCGTSTKDEGYVHVTKIYIDGIEFKIQYPRAAKLLEDHHISTKFVISK